MLYSQQTSKFKIPLFLTHVQAGFPSPADDYMEQKLDLHKHLVKHPAATIFVRVTDDSTVKAGNNLNCLFLGEGEPYLGGSD